MPQTVFDFEFLRNCHVFGLIQSIKLIRIFSVYRQLMNGYENAAPKGLFPPEPVPYKGPKLKVAIIGAGLAGMSTAVELLDQGHEVCVFNRCLLPLIWFT